jgi:hypothetical protein
MALTNEPLYDVASNEAGTSGYQINAFGHVYPDRFFTVFASHSVSRTTIQVKTKRAWKFSDAGLFGCPTFK